MTCRTILISLLAICWSFPGFASSRIKDITTIRGVGDLQLVGYGLVLGLKGSGDSLKGAPFTDQALQTMLESLGVNVKDMTLRSKNVAGVIVTADLPAFIGPGARIDIHVSSLGDAASLAGGSLVMTPLYAADGQKYATAQGPIVVTGFDANGAAARVTQGTPTSARVPNGAIVERSHAVQREHADRLYLELRNPDFTTATRVSDAINKYAKAAWQKPIARELDMRVIEVVLPKKARPARLLAEIGELTVEPNIPARVVIDDRTGTIVIGQDVTISTVAVTHGSITVQVSELPTVSQPNPFSEGQTVVVPGTEVAVQQTGGQIRFLGGVDLQDLVAGLNAMGLKPAGIVAILQAIKSAGALNAELVIQ